MLRIAALLLMTPLLASCLAGAVVGTTVGIAGAVVGTAVKTTAVIVDAAIPDGDDDEDKGED